MDVGKTIESFRLCTIDIDCKKLVLQRKRDGAHFEGPGYIRQKEDGTLVFKLYAVNVKNIRASDLMKSHIYSTSGELYPESSFYDLHAFGFDGTTWTASDILPHPSWDTSDNSVIVTGPLRSIITDLENSLENHYLCLHFFEEYDLPLNAMSNVEKNGNEHLILDRSDFEACGARFKIQSRKGSEDTIIEASRDNAWPEAFHLRIQEALQYITGKGAIWRVRMEGNADGLRLELASPNLKSTHTQFSPPISRISVDFRNHGWDLFDSYLCYVARQTEGMVWNPVAYHLHNACESTANSVDAWAIGISVAVEAISALIEIPRDGESHRQIKDFQKRMREWVSKQSDFMGLLERVYGLIGQLSNVSTKDKLYKISKDGYVNWDYVKHWQKLRGRHIHPSKNDLENPDSINYQKLMDEIHCVEVLLHQLTFYLIGYEGPFTDYGVRNWPSKQYPLVIK